MFFCDLNAKIPKNMRSRERLLSRSRIFIQHLNTLHPCQTKTKYKRDKLVISSFQI
jgi:hypothetical protein